VRARDQIESDWLIRGRILVDKRNPKTNRRVAARRCILMVLHLNQIESDYRHAHGNRGGFRVSKIHWGKYFHLFHPLARRRSHFYIQRTPHKDETY
jgi:hypothetical protein